MIAASERQERLMRHGPRAHNSVEEAGEAGLKRGRACSVSPVNAGPCRNEELFGLYTWKLSTSCMHGCGCQKTENAPVPRAPCEQRCVGGSSGL
jgi:hypothetical protein